MTERLLEPIGFPSASDEWIAFAQERPRRRLTRIDDLVATLCDGSDRSALESLTIWNDLQIDLTAVRNEAELLSEVHPDRDVREAMEAVLTQAQAKASSMMADSRLADLSPRQGKVASIRRRSACILTCSETSGAAARTSIKKHATVSPSWLPVTAN